MVKKISRYILRSNVSQITEGRFRQKFFTRKQDTKLLMHFYTNDYTSPWMKIRTDSLSWACCKVSNALTNSRNSEGVLGMLGMLVFISMSDWCLGSYDTGCKKQYLAKRLHRNMQMVISFYKPYLKEDYDRIIQRNFSIVWDKLCHS